MKPDGAPAVASLAPIIVALMLLGSVSLLGFIVAYWPAEPAVATARIRGEPPRIDCHEVTRDLYVAPSCRRRSSKWM